MESYSGLLTVPLLTFLLSVINQRSFTRLLFFNRDPLNVHRERNKGNSVFRNYELFQNITIKEEPFLKKITRSQDQRFDILVVVKSFVYNYGRRIAIRKTWGKKIYGNLIFVVGNIDTYDMFLDGEKRFYKDILELSLKDEYTNLVYKTLIGMAWILTSKLAYEYFHFIDDDRYLNVDILLSSAKMHLLSNDVKIFGYKISWALSQRKGKNAISESDYPFLFYPPYIIGGTMTTNLHTIKKIIQGFKMVKLIHIEDCYIGMIAYALSINLVHEPKISPSYVPPSDVNNFISAPGYDQIYRLFEAWTFMNITK